MKNNQLSQTYLDDLNEVISLAQDLHIIEREDSFNVSTQVSIFTRPEMKNGCSLTDVHGIEPQTGFSLKNLRTGEFALN